MTAATTQHVLAAVDGHLGHLTLNRPAAMNALTLEMVQVIDATLIAWERDPDVAVVLLDGAGERGFCAGGDIVALHDSAKRRDGLARQFWREEYLLDARIARYPKPIVAMMDGVVMGGGLGLTAHASRRVATDRLTTAMPEVGIGFAPDVGGTYLLSRAPGELGTHLALTGGRIGAADAVLCGLADWVIAASDVASLADALRNGDVDGALANTPMVDQTPRLERDREWIDASYAADTVEEILERLGVRPEPEATAAAEAIASKSPTSLKVTLRSLRSARALTSLEACLDQEYRTSCAFLETPDFVEGIRAAVIDKDRAPRWHPSRLRDVSAAEVERHFASVPYAELGLAEGIAA